MNELKKQIHIKHWEVVGVLMAVYDIFAVTFSFFFALWIRFDFHYTAIPKHMLRACLMIAPFYALLCVAVFAMLRLDLSNVSPFRAPGWCTTPSRA